MLRGAILGCLFLAGACDPPPEFQFDGNPCPDVSGRGENDLPPWPPAEDVAAAPNGPTLDFAEFEFIGRSDGCRDGAAVAVAGHDEQGDLSEASVRASLFVWAVGMDSLEAIEILEVSSFTTDDQRFEATARACVKQIPDHGPGVMIHIVDDAGNGSNAICARTFARTGVDLPRDPGSP